MNARASADGWASQLAAAAAAKRVATILNDAGIRFLFVKGVVSGRLYYPDVACRPLGDVDVRLPRAFVPAAIQALIAAGHVPRTRNRAYEGASFDVLGVDLDIESSFGPPGLLDLSIDAALTRVRFIDVDGVPFPAPDADDHALILATNVFKDKLERAKDWALRDAEIALSECCDEPRRSRFVARVREASAATLVFVVARALEPRRPELAALSRALEPFARSGYARAYQWLRRWPDSLAMRLLARIASDDAGLAAGALLSGATRELERWWRRRRA